MGVRVRGARSLGGMPLGALGEELLRFDGVGDCGCGSGSLCNCTQSKLPAAHDLGRVSFVVSQVGPNPPPQYRTRKGGAPGQGRSYNFGGLGALGSLRSAIPPAEKDRGGGYLGQAITSATGYYKDWFPNTVKVFAAAINATAALFGFDPKGLQDSLNGLAAVASELATAMDNWNNNKLATPVTGISSAATTFLTGALAMPAWRFANWLRTRTNYLDFSIAAAIVPDKGAITGGCADCLGLQMVLAGAPLPAQENTKLIDWANACLGIYTPGLSTIAGQPVGGVGANATDPTARPYNVARWDSTINGYHLFVGPYRLKLSEGGSIETSSPGARTMTVKPLGNVSYRPLRGLGALGFLGAVALPPAGYTDYAYVGDSPTLPTSYTLVGGGPVIRSSTSAASGVGTVAAVGAGGALLFFLARAALL